MRRSALLLTVLLLVGCGGRGSPKLSEAPPALAKKLMVARERQKAVSYVSIDCVGVGRTYRHVPITRCNVNMGMDPHVEAYCVLLRDGRLVTNHEDPAIPCRHDDAGWDRTTIVTGH